MCHKWTGFCTSNQSHGARVAAGPNWFTIG